MGRRLNQYLGSFAEHVYRLNLKGRSADTPKVTVDVRGAVEHCSE